MLGHVLFNVLGGVAKAVAHKFIHQKHLACANSRFPDKSKPRPASAPGCGQALTALTPQGGLPTRRCADIVTQTKEGLMKRLCAALPTRPALRALALALVLAVLALPAAALASDMFPKPPVPSSRTKLTRTAKTGQTNASGGQSDIKLGKVAKSSSDSSKTTTTKPPASLQ